MTLQRHIAEMRFAAITTRPVAVERVKTRQIFRPDGTEIRRPRHQRPERSRRSQSIPWWQFVR